jgi:hypothetical protein
MRLSPVQRDILVMLEETGKENLACISATLHHPPSDLNGAITGLMRLGLVIEDLEGSLPALSLTRAGKAALRA